MIFMATLKLILDYYETAGCTMQGHISLLFETKSTADSISSIRLVEGSLHLSQPMAIKNKVAVTVRMKSL